MIVPIKMSQLKQVDYPFRAFSGKCYNNFLLDSHGANLQVGPIGNIEIFNNVAQSKYGMGVQFLFSYDTPEQNPTNAPAGNGVIIMTYRLYFITM